MDSQKKLIGMHGPGSQHWVGDGFPVRNLFPSNGIESEINPFLMLDYAGPSRFKATDQPKGVDEHPHRGFETVTIAYQGAVEHRDSSGNSGTIFPGDVQWMTAASGVVHEEKHEREFAKKGGIFEMVQLWVNLPRAQKVSRPRYQTLTKEEIPVVRLPQLQGGKIASGAANENRDAGYARIIAGEWRSKRSDEKARAGAGNSASEELVREAVHETVRGPAKTFTPVNVFDVRMNAGAHTELILPDGHNTAVVLLRGNVRLNDAAADSDAFSGEAKIALFSAAGEAITLEASEDTILLVLSGEPILEPVASYGPFVMNTQEELAQAFADYRAGKMGHLH